MGVCVYCGKKAGFLRKLHQECESRATAGKRELIEIGSRVLNGGDAIEASRRVHEIVLDTHLPDVVVGDILAKEFESAVDEALSDGLLTEAEEQRLLHYKKTFSLNSDFLDRYSRSITRVRDGGILRRIVSGDYPPDVDLPHGIRFNFQKSEQLVWVFPDVEYYESRTRKEYVGASRGVRIRLAKGLYYSTSSFRGHPVETEHMVHVDDGTLAVTTKHLYFGGGSRASFRINFRKIVSFTPLDDALGVMRDAKTAKPQFFKVDDGWFIYNLVANVAEAAS